MPEGTTPFLDGLAGKYPSVDNYWAGAMPTEEAIYSIMLSRQLYDVDSVSGGRLVPLFAALRAAGFRSFILRGHSHFFQDAVSLYPRLYAPDGFVAAEDISGGRRPRAGNGLQEMGAREAARHYRKGGAPEVRRE